MMLASIVLPLLNVVQAVLIVSTGSTLMLNRVPYYIPADPVTTLRVSPSVLKSLPSAADLIPLTVISTPSLSFSQADLDAAVAIFSVADDVFQSSFVESKSFSFNHILYTVIVEKVQWRDSCIFPCRGLSNDEKNAYRYSDGARLRS